MDSKKKPISMFKKKNMNLFKKKATKPIKFVAKKEIPAVVNVPIATKQEDSVAVNVPVILKKQDDVSAVVVKQEIPVVNIPVVPSALVAVKKEASVPVAAKKEETVVSNVLIATRKPQAEVVASNEEVPKNRVCYEFRNVTVIYTNPYSKATKKHMPKLEAKVLDQYEIKRELYVGYYHKKEGNQFAWKYILYQFPKRRYEGELSEEVAKKFINRFLSVCQTNKSKLFNESKEGKIDEPRCKGFVHLTEVLYAGEKFSSDLI